MASRIFSHLFHVCLTQVSLLKEGILYPSEIAFKSNSINDKEHAKVKSVGRTKKVAWSSSCLHSCSAIAILLPLGNLHLPWD